MYCGSQDIFQKCNPQITKINITHDTPTTPKTPTSPIDLKDEVSLAAN